MNFILNFRRFASNYSDYNNTSLESQHLNKLSFLVKHKGNMKSDLVKKIHNLKNKINMNGMVKRSSKLSSTAKRNSKLSNVAHRNSRFTRDIINVRAMIYSLLSPTFYCNCLGIILLAFIILKRIFRMQAQSIAFQ